MPWTSDAKGKTKHVNIKIINASVCYISSNETVSIFCFILSWHKCVI